MIEKEEYWRMSNLQNEHITQERILAEKRRENLSDLFDNLLVSCEGHYARWHRNNYIDDFNSSDFEWKMFLSKDPNPCSNL